MNEDVKKFLKDIQTSIFYINEYIGKKKFFEDYIGSRQLQKSVERELEIIGEALSKALKIEPSLQISSARKIINLRNLISHAYDSVDDAMIWDIVINHVPKLKIEIDNLLEK